MNRETMMDQTLGGLAQTAIAKYLKQATRREAAVLANTDPEELHQMRVAMRRLRTALQVFAPAIQIPKAGREPRVADVARQLGKLRDLDVIEETLRLHYLPDLPGDEQATLLSALEQLMGHRSQVFKQVKQLLKGAPYQRLKTSLKDWTKAPEEAAIAVLPAPFALPDLVLPLVSRLWLHPGWLLGTTQLQVETDLSVAAADDLMTQHGEVLHSLRKQIKRVRYQLKLVSDFYGEALSADLEALETMQETLGQLQDTQVLAAALESVIPAASDQLPTLFAQLAEHRHRAWQHWQTLQTTYLETETRHRLRLLLLQPGQTLPEAPAAPVDQPSDELAAQGEASDGLDPQAGEPSQASALLPSAETSTEPKPDPTEDPAAHPARRTRAAAVKKARPGKSRSKARAKAQVKVNPSAHPKRASSSPD